MKKLNFQIATIILILMINTVSAQTIINKDTVHNSRAYLRFGIDPSTVIAFGYQRNIMTGFSMYPVTAYAEWKVSATRFAIKNSELKIGSILPVFGKGSFMIVNILNFSVGSDATSNFNSKKFAAADKIAFGFYKKTWFIATTAGYEKILLNHIENTEFYKTTYYEDAKDGWYKGAGGSFQFGIEGGGTFKKKYDLHLEIKKPYTEKFNSYGGSPFHVNLGLGYRF